MRNIFTSMDLLPIIQSCVLCCGSRSTVVLGEGCLACRCEIDSPIPTAPCPRRLRSGAYNLETYDSQSQLSTHLQNWLCLSPGNRTNDDAGLCAKAGLAPFHTARFGILPRRRYHDDAHFENEGRKIAWEIHDVDELIAAKKNTTKSRKKGKR